MSDLNFKIKSAEPKTNVERCICCGRILKHNIWEFCNTCDSDLTAIPTFTIKSRKSQREEAIKQTADLSTFNLHLHDQEGDIQKTKNPISKLKLKPKLKKLKPKTMKLKNKKSKSKTKQSTIF